MEVIRIRKRDTIVAITVAVILILFAALCAGMCVIKVMAFLKYLQR